MNQKFELTRLVLEHFGKDTSEQNIKKYIPGLWVNPRQKSKGGLRLTPAGLEALQTIGLKHYEIKIDDEIYWTNDFIIWLDQNIECPFYVTNRKIWVFGERLAVQLVLFSGNIQKFYRAKKKSKLNQETIDKPTV